MKLLFSSLCVAAIALVSACGNSDSDTKVHRLDEASWLIGDWQNPTGQGILCESWIKKDDSTYAGRGYAISEDDTLPMETIVLTTRQGTLAYIPTVPGQNNNQSVSFLLKSSTANQLVFENQQHDFPQRITYTRVNSDSIVAEISGLMNGQARVEKFPMKRHKNSE